MAKKITNINDVLNDLYFDALLLQKIDCSKEDNKKYKQMLKDGKSLPNGVFEYKAGVDESEGLGTFYTIYKPDLTQEEKLEYILFKQMSMISTIKSCVVFFAAITIISMIITFFILITNM